jgi:Zn-dependent peptidase ImmA (M78 family)
MALRVPFIADKVIERDAEALLAQYAHARNVEIKAPIQIEDIVEKHLKLHVEFDDLHHLLGIPRNRPGLEPDVFGAIWLETGEIVIDESLDPEEHPSIEGRYRFTLAHEGGGHWRLHRPLVQASVGQELLFDDTRQPTVVCRSSQSKERVEFQADLYASCLLMPRKLILRAWQDRFGGLQPFVFNWERSSSFNPGLLIDGEEVTEKNVPVLADFDFREIARQFAGPFEVSVQAMSIRLEKLGLLLRSEPKQQSLINFA